MPKGKKGESKMKNLPMNAEQMKSSSLDDLEKVVNVKRENGETMLWANEAYAEIKSRGRDVEQVGSDEGAPIYRIKR
jgi:hypothetical protein